jgi:hypothetical protein
MVVQCPRCGSHTLAAMNVEASNSYIEAELWDVSSSSWFYML